MYFPTPERNVTSDYLPGDGVLYLHAFATVVSTKGGDNMREGWVSRIDRAWEPLPEQAWVLPIATSILPLTAAAITMVAEAVAPLGPVETDDGATLQTTVPKKWKPYEDWLYVVYSTVRRFNGSQWVEEPAQILAEVAR